MEKMFVLYGNTIELLLQDVLASFYLTLTNKSVTVKYGLIVSNNVQFISIKYITAVVLIEHFSTLLSFLLYLQWLIELFHTYISF